MLKRLLKTIKKRKAGHCTAVIVAAGKATRMQGEDKILLNINGRSVIDHTLEVFHSSDMVDEIVIVTNSEKLGYMRSLCKTRDYKKVAAIVEGGETRVHSVMRGLDHVQNKSGLVAIHDGARPLVPLQVINDTIGKAISFHAAAPAIPVKDTIKSAKNHIVTSTPDRSLLYAIQTPQVFDYDLLRGALQHALDHDIGITDDCSAVEAIGMSVYLSHGSEENIKITTPLDVIIAEAIMKRRGTL